MKLFKKVLAMALASALALTLLVGCGKDNGKTTFTIVDYMNDWAAVEGGDIVYKADTALDTNAKNVVTVLQSTNAKTFEELYKTMGGVYQNENSELWKAFVKATTGSDTKNFYEIGFTMIDQKLVTDAAKDSVGMYQAQMMQSTIKDVYTPDGLKDDHGYISGSKLENTTYVGTATMSLGGKTYLVAVFRTAPKAAK